MFKDKYDWHIANCRRLRTASSDADIDLFVGIMQWEQDVDAWLAGVGDEKGYGTFLDCLHMSNIVDTHRYEDFKRQVQVCGGIDELREIGLHAAKKLLATPDDEPSIERPDVSARQALHEDYIAFRDRNDQPVSERHARAIREKHYRPPSNANAGPVNKYDQLKAEVRRLKHVEFENHQLKKRIEELEEALKKSDEALKKSEIRCAFLEKENGKLMRKLTS